MGAGVAEQRWLARGSIAAALVTALFVLFFAVTGGLRVGLASAACIAVAVASGYWFLSRRGVVRWVALALVVVAPVVVAVLLVREHLTWVVLVAVGLGLLALAAGRAALRLDGAEPGMPEHEAPPPRQAFLLMNPVSGGGKVTRFGLVEKARELGAEVALLEGPGTFDVEGIARKAVADGADLLGVAGGDGTQALVAGVAAEHGLPFLVISAGTRNHFALDLGLDRADPSRCLAALTDDGVELHVDLGRVAGRTFVNNVSFGAYAAIVSSDAYRDDKTRTTLTLLPDLLGRQAKPGLVAHVGDAEVAGPQAVLVSNNPYQVGDLVGAGRRARMDTGRLGVVAVTVDDARHAVGLLRHTKARGLTLGEAPEVVVTSGADHIPAGIDGESVSLPTPVTLTIQPGALRVRVPRDRPGVPRARPPWSWARLRQLAGVHSGGPG